MNSKVAGEIKQLLLIALYIYICLGALLLYTVSIAGVSNIGFAHAGYAAIKALVLAKFILLGHWLHLGEGRRDKPVIYSVVYQAVSIWGLLIVLSLIEQFVEGAIHGRSMSAGIVAVSANSLARSLVQSLILFLVLLPYVALRQLNAVMGEGQLRKLFFSVPIQ